MLSVRVRLTATAIWICTSSILGSCPGQEVKNPDPIKRTGSECINLLMNKEVRKSLKLDADQLKELDTDVKILIDSHGELLTFVQGGAIDVKKFSEVATKNRELQEKAEDRLAEILDPSQITDFAGICIKRNGSRTLSYPVVADALSLSFSQRQRIMRIQIAGSRGLDSKVSGKEFAERMKLQREKMGEDFISVLTERQKTLFDDMKWIGVK